MKKVINENTIKQMVREALAEVFDLSQVSAPIPDADLAMELVEKLKQEGRVEVPEGRLLKAFKFYASKEGLHPEGAGVMNGKRVFYISGVNENKKNKISTKSINEAVNKAFDKVVNESMDEISSDLANRAFNKSIDKRNNALGTPNYSKNEKQMRNFQNYYADTFDKEENLDGTNEFGHNGFLKMQDNGITYSFQTTCLFLEGKGFKKGPFEFADIVRYPNVQQQVCKMSPRVANTVSKWFRQNFESFKNANYVSEKIDWSVLSKPEFWTRYSNQGLNESIDEISIDTAMKGAAKANGEGRYGQGNTFLNYANDKLRQQFGKANVDYVNAEKICYFNFIKTRITLDRRGDFCIDKNGTEFYALNGGQTVKTDKATARIIAQWWSTYGNKQDKNYEKGLDWHYWAYL